MTRVKPLCNMCGLSCASPHFDVGQTDPMGLVGCTVQGGYDSTPGNGCGALDDMSSYTFSLCEFCLDRLFVRFKHPPVVTCHHDDLVEAWQPAEQRVREDDWRKDKDAFFKEQARRDAAREDKQ